MPELLTLTEVAAIARVSASTLFRHMRGGVGPKTAKIGRRTVVRRDDLRDWLATLDLRD